MRYVLGTRSLLTDVILLQQSRPAPEVSATVAVMWVFKPRLLGNLLYRGCVGFKRVIQQGNERSSCGSYTYSTCLVWKCAYWSSFLTSSVPPGCVWSLCFAVRAIKTGSLWNASPFFPVANRTPTSLTKRPSEERASPPLCSGPYLTRVVPNQVTEETVHSLRIMETIALSTHTATADKSPKNIPPPLYSDKKG